MGKLWVWLVIAAALLLTGCQGTRARRWGEEPWLAPGVAEDAAGGARKTSGFNLKGLDLPDSPWPSTFGFYLGGFLLGAPIALILLPAMLFEPEAPLWGALPFFLVGAGIGFVPFFILESPVRIPYWLSGG